MLSCDAMPDRSLSREVLTLDILREALSRYVERYGAGELLTVLAGPQVPSDLQADTLRALVVAVVREHRAPLDYDAIETKLGGRFKRRSIQNALAWAVKEKRVARAKPGVFRPA